MNPGGEASRGPAQTVVVRLGAGAAGRFLLGPPVAAGACGVLMGPADRGVDVDLPRDQSRRIRPGLQPGQQFGPSAITLPAAEEPIDRLPRPVLRRQIPPRSTGTNPPPDPIEQPPSAQRRPPQHHDRQEWLQHCPLLVRKIPSPHTAIVTAQGEPRSPLLKHGLAASPRRRRRVLRSGRRSGGRGGGTGRRRLLDLVRGPPRPTTRCSSCPARGRG